MKSEFDKARDQFSSEMFERKYRPSTEWTYKECFDDGADWAFEWCQKENADLKAKLAKAMHTLRHYADENNYWRGRTARETLSEVAEMEAEHK